MGTCIADNCARVQLMQIKEAKVAIYRGFQGGDSSTSVNDNGFVYVRALVDNSREFRGLYMDPPGNRVEIQITGRFSLTPDGLSVEGPFQTLRIFNEDGIIYAVTEIEADISEVLNAEASVDAGNNILFSGDDLFMLSPDLDRQVGLTGNDTMFGDAGDDTLIGGAGNDRVFGQSGNDRLIGGSGNDLIAGGTGSDVISGGGGDDNIKGNGGDDNLKGNGGSDVIKAGGGADTVKGGGGADVINGGNGADLLQGGGGNDTITGKGGDDTLKGNGGADVFQFRASDRNDTILDFRQGQDLIEIQTGANSFAALDIEQDGRDVLIGVGAGQVRVVTDSVGAFDEDDFIF